MEQEMTRAEGEGLKQALLSAFPRPGALEQMLFFQVGEQLNVIAGGSNYGEVVFNLILWAQANDKVDALITGARKDNPGNVKLRAFEELYRLYRQGRQSRENPSDRYLPAQLRSALTALLLKIPIVTSYRGRSSLLNGIDGVSSHLLVRNSEIAKVDLEGIIDQLDRLGRQLDYALVRLKEADKIASRAPLPLIRRQPRLQRGMRLNIVQHARGGPLLYAIRNNFYVDVGSTQNVLRYLTDTEPGSSGSPVFDDSWLVVALHRASAAVSPQTYDMQVRGMPERNIVRYNNEGTAIHAILDHLPIDVKQEVNMA